MDRLISFFAHWLGMFMLALFNGLLGWFLLDSTFDLGYWVWVGISFMGTHIVKTGIIVMDSQKNLTARLKDAKL